MTRFVEACTAADMAQAMAMAVYDPKLIGRKVAEFLVEARAVPGARAALRAIAQTCFPHGEQANNLRPLLHNPPCPVQIIWGEADQVLPVTQVQGIPAQDNCHFLARTGHLPHIEQAATVNALARDFYMHVKTPDLIRGFVIIRCNPSPLKMEEGGVFSPCVRRGAQNRPASP